MDNIVNFLKNFSEKHILQTMASLSIAILGIAFFPNILQMTNRVGKMMYFVLIFCVAFLLIQATKSCISFGTKKYKENSEYKKKSEKEKKKKQDDELEALENLWDFVDSLSAKERMLLRDFLENENSPVEIIGVPRSSRLLCNNKIVAWMDVEETNGLINNTKMEYQGRMVYCLEENDKRYSSLTRIYCLKDSFYRQLKLSFEKYHRISHFDLEENNGNSKNAQP